MDNYNKNHIEGELGDVGDINVEDKLLPVVSYPLDIFTSPFQKLIKQAADSLNVEQEIVAGSILTVTSGAIGNTIRISPKTGWEAPPFLWFIIIAKSGDGKTPTTQTFIKEVDLLQAEAKQAYDKEVHTYWAEKEKVKKKKSKETSICKYPVQPTMRHYIVNDATIPALANVFESTPRGVLYYADELSGLIMGLDQYKKVKGNDRQHYLQLFDAASWKIDRLDRVQYIPNTGMAIFGGIQPEIMPSVINVESFIDGFISRFIVSFASEKTMVFSKECISKKYLEIWRNHLRLCYRIPLNIDANGKVEPLILSFDEESLSIWVKFHDELGAIKPYLSDQAKVFIPKLITYSLKFAGILHVFRELNEKESLKSSRISIETTQHAISLTRYYLGQAGKVLKLYASTEKSLDERNKRLLQVLCEVGNQVKGGKLPLSIIRDKYNMGIPDAIKLENDNRQLSAMLKKFGLQTKHSTGNVSFLVWEGEKMNILFSKHISPTSPTSPTLNLETIDAQLKQAERQEIEPAENGRGENPELQECVSPVSSDLSHQQTDLGHKHTSLGHGVNKYGHYE